MKLKIYFAAYDPVIHSNIKTESVDYFPSTPSSTQTVTFASGNLDLASTYKGCYLLSVYCRQAPFFFIFNNNWQVLNPNTLIFYTSTTAIRPSNCGWYDIHLLAVVIYPTSEIAGINAGALIATPGSPSPLPIDLAQPQSFFLMGLIEFTTNNGCLDFSLAASNIEVDAASDFNVLVFNYVQVVYLHPPPLFLDHILSSPFTNEVLLFYVPLSEYVLVVPFPQFDSTLVYSDQTQDTIWSTLLAPVSGAEISVTF